MKLSGGNWCQFHLPAAQKRRWDEARIAAFNADILARIDREKQAYGVADLSGVVFPGSITFEHYAGEANGLPDLLFLKAVFSGDTSFQEVAFVRDVDFGRATFAGDAMFQGVTFGGDARFKLVTFFRGASFEGANFGAAACFDQANFVERAGFQGATFSSRASFQAAIFTGESNFGDARLCHDIWFTRSQFQDTAWFKGCTIFGGDAWFDEVTFGRRAEFKSVTFRHNASFEGATFGGYARFNDVTFGKNAWFVGDPTREGPSGRGDWFSGFVSFRGARFANCANFTNRRFLRGADFRSAEFEVAPEFHNAMLHQDTRFSGTRFLDRRGTEAVDAASAYRTLKLAMESIRARDEEAMFYAYEQESLRAKKETPWSVRLFSLLYEQTADYGRSFMRPLFWLVLGFFLFFLSYAFVGGHVLWGDGGSVFRFALQQVFQPFWVFRPETTVPGTNATVPVWLAFMAALHSVLTLTFLTLFLLALRRRFRLD